MMIVVVVILVTLVTVVICGGDCAVVLIVVVVVVSDGDGYGDNCVGSKGLFGSLSFLSLQAPHRTAPTYQLIKVAPGMTLIFALGYVAFPRGSMLFCVWGQP